MSKLNIQAKMLNLNGRSPIRIHVQAPIGSIRYSDTIYFGSLDMRWVRKVDAHNHFGKVRKLAKDIEPVLGYRYLNFKIQSFNYR